MNACFHGCGLKTVFIKFSTCFYDFLQTLVRPTLDANYSARCGRTSRFKPVMFVAVVNYVCFVCVLNFTCRPKLFCRVVQESVRVLQFVRLSCEFVIVSRVVKIVPCLCECHANSCTCRDVQHVPASCCAGICSCPTVCALVVRIRDCVVS